MFVQNFIKLSAAVHELSWIPADLDEIGVGSNGVDFLRVKFRLGDCHVLLLSAPIGYHPGQSQPDETPT